MYFQIIGNQMLVLFLLVVTGYYVFRKKYVTRELGKSLSVLVVHIFNPALVLMGVLTEEKLGSLKDAAFVGMVSAAMFAVLVGLGCVLPLLLKVSVSQRSLFNVMTVFSNVGFMGFPVVKAIFGTGALFYAALFVLPYNLLVYTYGIKLMSRSMGVKNKFRFRDLCNSGVGASILAIFIFALDIRVPYVISSTLNTLGNLATPVSMMLIGVSLAQMNLREVFCDFRLYLFSFIKLLVIPASAVFLLKDIIKDPIIYGVTIIMLCMPVGSITTMLASEVGADDRLTSKTIILTTLLSVLSITLITSFAF